MQYSYWVWGIKFNFLPFSSLDVVGFLFYGVFSCLDGVFGVVLGSTSRAAPDMFAPLKFFRSAMGVPDRLASKIYSEFQDHFQRQIIDSDIIIIVDTSHSEINYYSAENYLSGSFQITLRMDRFSGKVIDTYNSRKDDAMHLLDPNTKSIIGLLIYKRITSSDGRIHIQGRIISNEFVMNDDRRSLLTKIAEAFFG